MPKYTQGGQEGAVVVAWGLGLEFLATFLEGLVFEFGRCPGKVGFPSSLESTKNSIVHDGTTDMSEVVD